MRLRAPLVAPASALALTVMLPPLAQAAPPAKQGRLAPIDQCGADPGFRAFRRELLDVATRRDARRLLQLVDEDIDISHDGQSGRQEFRRIWELATPAQSPLWKELAEVLRLGCAMDGTVAMAPSFVNQLSDRYDVFETMVAVRPGSVLRAKPDPQAKAVATLDWDVLTLRDWDGTSLWIPVRLADGRKGYARREDLRSPIDYRAFFEKVGGRWKMTIFIAGD